MADIYRSDIVPVDLNHALSRKHVGSVLATGDNGANRFGASVLRDGKAVDLTGCGVTAYFMRPGQNALVMVGETDGHVAYVDLPQACYTVQSSFTLTIKVTGNGITSALRIIDGYILLTQTEELDAPTETVPTLDDIFAQIAAMEQATAEANAVVSEYNGKVAEQDASIAALTQEMDAQREAVEAGYYTDYNQLSLWESGAVDTNGLIANSYRIRTKDYIPKGVQRIECANGYAMMVYRYASGVVDLNFYTGWIASLDLDQENYEYKVIVKENGGAEIGSDVSAHYLAIKMYGKKLPATPIIIDKQGNGDFTSLVKGLRKAYTREDLVFYVRSGNYDIIQEFEEEYGSDFFTNYTPQSIRGIVLLNRCKVIFSHNARVTCHYEGDNDVVKEYFAPFNSGVGGFELEGLNISASNVRYCLHDELGANTMPYVSRIRNCCMKLDNTNSSWGADQCIGGGLGKSAIVDISGCCFESVRNGKDDAAVSYHNSQADGAKSHVVIKDNYIAGNKTIRLSWYGPSTSVTRAIVTNNNVGAEIVCRAENAESTVQNVELLAWNNVVRG